MRAGDGRSPGISSARGDSPRAEPFWAALLVLAACVLAWDAARGSSATTDEPVHLASGVEIVREGTGRWNVEHPPLAKALAGIALDGVALRPARSPFERTGPSAPLLLSFLWGNETSGDVLLHRGRLPFLVLLAALLLAVRAEARARFGALAGLLALAFVALEPTVLAHAGVVHTDLAVTLFAVLSLAPLRVLGDPRRRWAVAGLGASWGLALLSKYDAPLLALALLPLGLHGVPRLAWRRVAARVVAASGIALLVALAGFAWAYRHQSAADRDAVTADRIERKGQAPRLASALVAAGRVLPPVQNLGTGALSIALQSRVGAGPNYFMGRVRPGGSPLYFPAALATKTTLALLVAFAAAVVLATPARRAAGLFLAGIALFCALSAGTSYNIGVRHVLFAYPVAALVAGGALAWSAERLARRTAGILLGGLVALKLAETGVSHPFHISFFNAGAGGRDGGHRFFVDSNLDWGQDLARLAARAPSLGPGPIPAVVFGGDLPSRYRSLRPPEPLDLDRPGQILAIGEQALALGPELLASKGAREEAARLEAVRSAVRARGRRVGTVGGSIGIWRLSP